jgi:hypothetical protein
MKARTPSRSHVRVRDDRESKSCATLAPMTRLPRPPLDAPAAEWLVYGDSLQEANDPRGKLVGLSHGVDEGRVDKDVRDAYVHEHCTALLGLPDAHLAAYDLTWRFSELAAASVRIKPADNGATLVCQLLEAPAAELLHDITLIGIPDGGTVELMAAMDVVASTVRVTSLGLVDDRARNARMLVSRDFDPDDNLVAFGPLRRFWSRLEHLSLEVADSHAIDLEAIDAPVLRSFALRSLRYADWEDAEAMRDRLGAAKWPRLESFELRLVETWAANVPHEVEPYVPIYSAPDYEGRDDTDDGESEGIDWQRDLKPVLATLKNAPLRRLALTSFASSASVLEAVAESGLLAVIEELDLSDSALNKRDVDWMIDHADVFAKLQRLVVERTSIGEGGAKKLRKINPRTIYSEAGHGARYRYVVGQE